MSSYNAPTSAPGGEQGVARAMYSSRVSSRDTTLAADTVFQHCLQCALGTLPGKTE